MSQPLKSLAPASLKTIEVDYFAPLAGGGAIESSSTDSSSIASSIPVSSVVPPALLEAHFLLVGGGGSGSAGAISFPSGGPGGAGGGGGGGEVYDGELTPFMIDPDLSYMMIPGRGGRPVVNTNPAGGEHGARSYVFGDSELVAARGGSRGVTTQSGGYAQTGGAYGGIFPFNGGFGNFTGGGGGGGATASGGDVNIPVGGTIGGAGGAGIMLGAFWINSATFGLRPLVGAGGGAASTGANIGGEGGSDPGYNQPNTGYGGYGGGNTVVASSGLGNGNGGGGGSPSRTPGRNGYGGAVAIAYEGPVKFVGGEIDSLGSMVYHTFISTGAGEAYGMISPLNPDTSLLAKSSSLSFNTILKDGESDTVCQFTSVIPCSVLIDFMNAPASGITVTITGTETHVFVATDDDFSYFIELPVGSYNVTINKDGGSVPMQGVMVSVSGSLKNLFVRPYMDTSAPVEMFLPPDFPQGYNTIFVGASSPTDRTFMINLIDDQYLGVGTKFNVSGTDTPFTGAYSFFDTMSVEPEVASFSIQGYTNGPNVSPNVFVF